MGSESQGSPRRDLDLPQVGICTLDQHLFLCIFSNSFGLVWGFGSRRVPIFLWGQLSGAVLVPGPSGLAPAS